MKDSVPICTLGPMYLVLMTNCSNVKHRADITEVASAQVPIWILDFGLYGQLRAVRKTF